MKYESELIGNTKYEDLEVRTKSVVKVKVSKA